MKAQVTAFVIVGLVVLFTLGFAILIVSKLNTRETKVETTPEKTNLRGCLQDTAEISLQAIGLAGGTQSNLVTLSDGSRIHVGIKNNFEALEPLCLWNGPNRPNASADDRNTCLPGTYQLIEPQDNVLQYEIAKTLSAAAVACNNTEPVTVVFGQDNVNVLTQNVSVLVPVRFKRIYNLAYRLAVLDVTNPAFDKMSSSVLGCTETSTQNNCLLPGMIVNITTISPYTIVRITDVKSTINGQPFIFEYAVENRPPVIMGAPLTTVQAPATVQLQTYDPDEQALSASCPGASCTTTSITFDDCAQGAYTYTVSDGTLAASVDMSVAANAGATCP